MMLPLSKISYSNTNSTYAPYF